MNVPHSDALVFFGATGDLAYKKIFPSLHAMLKRGNLKVPVIGVAKTGWNLSQLKDPLLQSVTPVYEYEPKTWGPGEVEQKLTPIGGWQNPVLTSQQSP